MITARQSLAALGFAFVAAWIGFSSFGYAILCLLGALVFYGAGTYLEGVIDTDVLRERLTGRPPTTPANPQPPGAAPRRSGRPRVQ